ncbi:MAG: NUDIX hydrolase [Dehalococcoidia bacterium]|nr:NUDIX hydrolase [Chloroflexi bacterium CFX7]MCK6564070.1 NUDIX hydrolase [Dehalococcoidia bacterium]MCL4230588.1 NUDIX hydrolase [Dehalococcoidia bacterium]NUQ54770.1 NUDIX hydrolase [Dehalococcoidia bacterium]
MAERHPGAPDGYRYCPQCGHGLVPGAGTESRPGCPSCGYIRYRNPAVGVAVVLQDTEGRVLLGKRATGEYAGLWCIPCGYVEWEEEIRDAAVREMREETGLEVEIGEVFAVHSNFHNPKLHTVGVWFRGRAAGGALLPVDNEFSELAYVDPAAPPPLAFPTDALVLAELTGGG